MVVYTTTTIYSTKKPTPYVLDYCHLFTFQLLTNLHTPDKMHHNINHLGIVSPLPLSSVPIQLFRIDITDHSSLGFPPAQVNRSQTAANQWGNIIWLHFPAGVCSGCFMLAWCGLLFICFNAHVRWVEREPQRFERENNLLLAPASCKLSSHQTPSTLFVHFCTY